MSNISFFLTLIFVTINAIQTWLIFTLRRLIKGGITIGLIEFFEFSLMTYLLLKKELTIFFCLVFIEIIQWLSIAYFATRG